MRLALAAPAMVLERLPLREALRRSGVLVRHSWWRVLGVLVLAALIAGVVGQVLQLPFTAFGGGGSLFTAGDDVTLRALVLAQVGAGVAQVLTAPFNSGVRALLYIDRRMRAEGLDVALAAAAARGVTCSWPPRSPGTAPGTPRAASSAARSTPTPAPRPCCAWSAARSARSATWSTGPPAGWATAAWPARCCSPCSRSSWSSSCSGSARCSGAAGRRGCSTGSAELDAAGHRAAAEALAAQGHLAEAVRERLRAVVRALEERGVLDPRPGRTSGEVARDAGAAAPALAARPAPRGARLRRGLVRRPPGHAGTPTACWSRSTSGSAPPGWSRA